MQGNTPLQLIWLAAWGSLPHSVKLVPQTRREARLADRLLDACGIELVVRPGRRNDVLLDHDRTHVVGAAVQRYLSGGLADGEPRSLDVADVVQNQSARRMDSNGEKRVATPCRSNSVPDERKIQGMKARKP